MDHTSVQQVVTFAMPHKMLGEAVAAVVVLKEGQRQQKEILKLSQQVNYPNLKCLRKLFL
jgi:acyl-coenzyme A synthetase/AMP-(fatty) acid ligase